MSRMSFEEHKKKAQEFANYYEINGEKIDKGVLRLNVNPSVALEFKARMMYLTGGYPISQTHMYNDATFSVVNQLFENINIELSDPNSPLYNGLGVTKTQVSESTKYMETLCTMAGESRYKNSYITPKQIENRFKKVYNRNIYSMPSKTLIRPMGEYAHELDRGKNSVSRDAI